MNLKSNRREGSEFSAATGINSRAWLLAAPIQFNHGCTRINTDKKKKDKGFCSLDLASLHRKALWNAIRLVFGLLIRVYPCSWVVFRRVITALGRSSFSAASLACAAVFLPVTCSFGAATNLLSNSLTSSSLPETGPSLLRVLGALALVLGLFLGAAWMVRNGRFSVFGQGRSGRLNVVESRSLGARQALYVVSYGQERFLIGSTPAGINLLSHLAPPQEGEEPVVSQPGNGVSFARALTQVLSGKAPKNGGAP
jgi:flagellar biosynthetic protein FliO